MFSSVVNSLRPRPVWMKESDPAWEVHAEQVLAAARLVLASASLVAIYIDPTEPTRYADLCYALLALYLAFSAAVFAVLRNRKVIGARFVVAVLTVDAFWALVISLFTEGPNSPFFLFLIFVCLSSAYRWGMRRTLITSSWLVFALLLQAAILTLFPVGRYIEGEFEANRMMMRAAYLIILAFLAGYLAETEKRQRAEMLAVNTLMRRVQVATAFNTTVRSLAADLHRWFAPRRIVLATFRPGMGAGFTWEVSGETPDARWTEIPASAIPEYLLPVVPETAVFLADRSATLVMDEAGQETTLSSTEIHNCLQRLGAHEVLSAGITLQAQWSARLLVVDPAPAASGAYGLRFLARLAQQVGPAVHNVYLSRSMRAQATAAERARVARELHDGVVQELAAMSLEVEVIRRQAGEGTPVGRELGRIRGMLANEVANVRELMNQYRPLDIEPSHLPEFLASAVEKFQRDTGIAATFICDLEEVPAPRWVCRELARIAQEALVNVRRHSQANHTVVTLRANDGVLALAVDDDGKGFGFDGRYSLEELDARRKGPVVIKERVRSIHADLVVVSQPGQGARIEVRYPLARRSAANG